MRIGTITLSFALLLFSTLVFADLTAVSVRDTDQTTVRIFYREGKEIGRQILSKAGEAIETRGKIPDGVVKEYDANGKLAFEWKYKSGKLEGGTKIFSPDGALIAEDHYRKGKLEGVSKKYYKSGKLLAERNYKEDKLDGMTKMYYESGSVFAELNYKDGKMDGTSMTYYEDGMLGTEEIYKDGQKIKIKSYDQEGKLLFDQDYTDQDNTSEKSLTSTSTMKPHKNSEIGGANKK